jgi:DNA-binding transcriptional MerR regulator
MAAMEKSPDAFRTISEVADWLGVPTHVLRFWESRFTQVKPVKRAGGRRYYRPSDMELIGGIKRLLHDDGMTIRGVQKLLREKGVKHVASLSPPLYTDAAGAIEDGAVEHGAVAAEARVPAPEPEEAVEEAAFAEVEPDEATGEPVEAPVLAAPEPEPEPLPDFGEPTEPEAEPDEETDSEVADLSALDGEPVEAPEPVENVVPLAPVTDEAAAEPTTGRESLAAGDLFDRPFVPAHAADAEDEEEEDDALLSPELSLASRLKLAVAHHDLSGHAARLSDAQGRLLALRSRMDGR